MATLNVQLLVKQMLAAAGKVLKKDWPEARKYAELEFTKLAQTMAMIQTQSALGELSKTEAKLLMDIQRNAARSVLLTLEGLGALAVEKAINAALRVVKETVNVAVGFALL
jgi:hypothetical protein